MSATHTGVCHLCGSHGPLSFEHVPPRAAFNDRPVVMVEFAKAFNLAPDDPTPKGKISQRGAGNYTLCPDCNNSTGGWYGGAFAQWCFQAADLLIRSRGKPSLIYPYYLYPLRVLKQITAMFFSVNRIGFLRKHEALADFVLNRERSYLPAGYRFFVYYNIEGRFRYQDVAATFDIATGQHRAFSEITFPPFGYVLVLKGDPPSRELFEVTHFARYGYDDVHMMQLRPPVFPTHLAIPGDYRTKDEIREHMLRQEDEAAVNLSE